MKDVIMIKSLLHTRGIDVDTICPMCGEAEEIIIHLFVKCQEVQRFWYISILRLKVEEFDSTSFQGWVRSLQVRFKDRRL